MPRKRVFQSPKGRAPKTKRLKPDGDSGNTTRGRGRRGRARANSEEQTEPAVDTAPKRRHVLIEDEEEDDAQRAYEEEGGSYIEDIYIPPKFKAPEDIDFKERLVIEKITCTNFKSYGGIKEMGPFHKSFSSIVGPNGNGKSNVIDAMLFVFGYRAAKIRCKKLSVLIHKSELLPNLSSCSVTVHFQKICDDEGDDEDSYKVIPNSQITVTRKACKDNSSTYWLNQKKVRFQEVAEFLKSNGIDIVHNRFLILQGEVESISQMPPKQTPSGEIGLLEFLEDIIGSKRYLKSLVKLEDRVEDLTQTRLERLQIVDLVEKERRSLDEPAKKAKEYLANLNKKTIHEYRLGQFKCFEKQEHLKEVEEEKSKLNQNVQQILDRLTEISATNATKKVDFEKADAEHKQLESEYKKKKKALDTADTEYTKSNEQLQRANEQRKKLIKDISKNETELEKLDEIPVSHESEIVKLGHRNEELESQVGTEQIIADKECAKLQININAVVAEKEDAEKNHLTLKKVKDQKKRETDSLQSDLNVYKEQEKVEREKFEVVQTELERLKDAIQQKDRTVRMSGGNEPLQENLAQKTGEFDKLVSLEKEKKAQIDKMQDSLEEMRSALDGSNVHDAIYKAFAVEKKQGKLTGLHGRLKDLATIDEKYNVAVTMATGMLDYWVCDDDITASACIKTLKSKGLQVQTFVCLSRIGNDKRNMENAFRAPPNSHRLFDLLKYTKHEFRPAFYKALRNTLVADNLNIASEIAYGLQRHRVVTLKGEVIDVSGSMTGGGRQRIPGKMNSGMAACMECKFTQEQYIELKKQHERAAKEYEELCSRKRNLDQEVRALMAEFKKHKLATQNFQNDLNSLKSQMPLKEARLKEQESKWKKNLLDPAVVKQKEKLLDKAMAQLTEATGPWEIAEKEVAKKSEKLRELNIDKKGEIRRKLDKLLEMKKKVLAELNKFTIELKNYKKNRVKVIDKIENLKSEKEKLQKLMESTNEAKKRIEVRATEIKAALDKLEGSVKESSEKLSGLKESASEFRDEENKLNKEKIKTENEFKKIKATYDKIMASIVSWKENMAGLVLKQIPGQVIEPIKPLDDDELVDFDEKKVEREIAELKHKLGKEEPNLEILDLYQQKWDEFYKVVQDLSDISARREKFRTCYLATMCDRLNEFMYGFAKISSKVKELFRMISMGGDAELEILDCFDPFASGIEFTVRPARKTWKQISYLSGGEKTLSSLALVFALHYFKPSPFYVMDEIDAALDFKNVSIIANYIKERTKSTQFIIISLRSNMFELADSLLGVYKVDNMSYSIHLGVGKLIKQLRKKFEEAGKPFPLVSEYPAIPLRKKLTDTRSPDLFIADVTNIPEPEAFSKETDPKVVSQPVGETETITEQHSNSSESLFTTPLSSPTI